MNYGGALVVILSYKDIGHLPHNAIMTIDILGLEATKSIFNIGAYILESWGEQPPEYMPYQSKKD